MTSHRAFAATIVTGIVVGGAAFLATARAWSEVRITSSGMPSDVVEVTGSQAVPIVSAMCLVVMAGSIAVFAAARWLRVVVGVVIAAAAAIGVAYVVSASGALRDAVVVATAQSPAMTGDSTAQLRTAAAADATPWRWATLVLLLVAGLVGVAVVMFGRQWPVMGRRYEAPSRADDRVGRRGETSEADLWRALDRGDDPTG